MRRLPRTARSWLLVLAVTLAASAVLTASGLPSPVLFGSLLGGLVQALTGSHELDMPPLVFRVGRFYRR